MQEKLQQKDTAIGQKDESYYGVGGFIWEIIKVFLLAVVIVTPIRVFLFQPFFVQGDSMVPNFKDGQYLIVNEFGYKTTRIGFDDIDFFSVHPFKDIKRGDTVVFRYPNDPKQFFIKRIIGMPGEKVEIRGGKVYIVNKDNPTGLLLDESGYLASGVKTSTGSNFNFNMQIGDSEYFVMGDNRQFSHDSRHWGNLAEDHIMGKVLLRAWPVGTAKLY